MEVPDLNQVLKIRIARIIQNAIKETMREDISTSKNKKYIAKIIKQEIVDKSILAEDIISGLILMQMDESQDVDIIYDTIDMKKRNDNKKNTRFFINLGKNHGLRTNELKFLLQEMTGIKRDNFKNLDVHEDFSFFEADSRYINTISKAFEREKYQSKRIIVEVAKEKPTHKHAINKKNKENNTRSKKLVNKKTNKKRR